MDSTATDILQWKPSPLAYNCTFGEIPVFSLKLTGVKTAPNLFEIPAQTPCPVSCSKKHVSHAYFIPCSDELKANLCILNMYIQHVYAVYHHYFVDTCGELTQYMTRFKGKALNCLKRKIEKSNTEKPYSMAFKNLAGVEEYLLIAKKISEKSYQEKALGYDLPTDHKFRDKLFNIAANNLFRGYILYTEYSRYSADTMPQYKVIEDRFMDPLINTYDLCSDEGKHNELFSTVYKTCCDVFFFPATALYISTVYLKSMIEYVARKIISPLVNLGVKGRIKKFIRRFK
jgi:hypothetical protein